MHQINSIVIEYYNTIIHKFNNMLSTVDSKYLLQCTQSKDTRNMQNTTGAYLKNNKNMNWLHFFSLQWNMLINTIYFILQWQNGNVRIWNWQYSFTDWSNGAKVLDFVCYLKDFKQYNSFYTLHLSHLIYRCYHIVRC